MIITSHMFHYGSYIFVSLVSKSPPLFNLWIYCHIFILEMEIWFVYHDILQFDALHITWEMSLFVDVN